MRKSDSIRAYFAWGVVCFLWGTTYLAIRIGVQVLPPALFAGIRFIVAGSILVVILRLRGYPYPARQELSDIAIVGIALLTIANGTVVWAEQWVPSGLAALIVATLPFWIVGIESVLPMGDRLNSRKVIGILVGFAGLVVLLLPELRSSIESAYIIGIFVMFIAPISWGGGSIYSKYRKIKTRPLMAAAFQMLFGGSVLTVIGLANGEVSRFTWHPQGLAAMAYLIIFGSIVGYGSFMYALSKLPASFVTTYAYINPVIAVILGWLILNERLDWMLVLATSMILLGVILVQSGAARSRMDQQEHPTSNSIKT
jgi:drug/metabolite transporter (DMT)-like permease